MIRTSYLPWADGLVGTYIGEDGRDEISAARLKERQERRLASVALRAQCLKIGSQLFRLCPLLKSRHLEESSKLAQAVLASFAASGFSSPKTILEIYRLGRSTFSREQRTAMGREAKDVAGEDTRKRARDMFEVNESRSTSVLRGSKRSHVTTVNDEDLRGSSTPTEAKGQDPTRWAVKGKELEDLKAATEGQTRSISEQGRLSVYQLQRRNSSYDDQWD